MQVDGSNYEWKSYPVQTLTGYNIVMFRLTANEVGTPIVTSKGPLLLIHGMFSKPSDWLGRKTTDLPALPIQLAEMGFDVWVGCTRGRSITSTHETLNENPVAYWDFTFE